MTGITRAAGPYASAMALQRRRLESMLPVLDGTGTSVSAGNGGPAECVLASLGSSVAYWVLHNGHQTYNQRFAPQTSEPDGEKRPAHKAVTDVENEIVKVIGGAATTVADVVESVSPGKAPKKGAKPAAAKPAKKKRTMSAAGRARISAATKARWAARRANQA